LVGLQGAGQRTATINRIRGLLTEVGIVMPKKAETVRKLACQHLEDLPGYLNQVVNDLLDELSILSSTGSPMWFMANAFCVTTMSVVRAIIDMLDRKNQTTFFPVLSN
jgi:hypothetical protein